MRREVLSTLSIVGIITGVGFAIQKTDLNRKIEADSQSSNVEFCDEKTGRQYEQAFLLEAVLPPKINLRENSTIEI